MCEITTYCTFLSQKNPLCMPLALSLVIFSALRRQQSLLTQVDNVSVQHTIQTTPIFYFSRLFFTGVIIIMCTSGGRESFSDRRRSFFLLSFHEKGGGRKWGKICQMCPRKKSSQRGGRERRGVSKRGSLERQGRRRKEERERNLEHAGLRVGRTDGRTDPHTEKSVPSPAHFLLLLLSL